VSGRGYWSQVNRRTIFRHLGSFSFLPQVWSPIG
jgi:hypothetical protein